MTSPLDQYDRMVRQIAVTAKSDNGLVEVTRNAAGEINVKIKPGTFSQLRTENRVAAEIQSALTAALRQHRAAARQLRHEIFGDDI